MLLLGLYIGGVIATALSCLGATIDEGEPCHGGLLELVMMVAVCLFWPMSMSWMIVDTYLKNK